MFRRTLGVLVAWGGFAGLASAQGYGWEPGAGSPPLAAPRALPVGQARPISVQTFNPVPAQTFTNWSAQNPAVSDPPRGVPPPKPSTPNSDTLPVPQPLPSPPVVEFAPSPAELGYATVPGPEVPSVWGSGAETCPPLGRGWTNFEWLYWITSGQTVPPSASTSWDNSTTLGTGVVGVPSTSVLFGNQRTNNEWRSGFRFLAGYWLDTGQRLGVEGDFFVLNESRQGGTFGTNPDLTDGEPLIVARPFNNALLGIADSSLVSFPGVIRGRLDVRATNEVIGGGVNVLLNLGNRSCERLDFVAGYRYLGIKDGLTFQEDEVTLRTRNGVPPGVEFGVSEEFRTTNNFNGGLIGLGGEKRFRYLYVSGRATVAFGGVSQLVEIDGTSSITPPDGTAATYVGGLYAQPSNIGRHERTTFAVLPELNLRAGLQLTEYCRVYVAYNAMYLSNVVRAGDQIDRTVNPNFVAPRTLPVVGPQLPAFDFRATNFWMQGVSLGLELRF